jgi:hypothetical protein
VRRGIHRILASQPRAALRGWFHSSTSEIDLIDIWFLLDAVDNRAELEQLASGHPAALQLVDEYVERSVRQRAAESTGTPAVRTARALRPSLPEIIAQADEVALLSHTPVHDQVMALSVAQRDQLTLMVEDIWARSTAASGTPIHTVRRIDAGRWRAESEAMWQLIHWAAELTLPLSDEEWFAAGNLGLPGHEFDTWLQATFRPTWTSIVATGAGFLNADGARAVLRSAPHPLTREAAEAVAGRCQELIADPRANAVDLLRICAERLVEDAYQELAHAVARTVGSNALDDIIVRLGDADAERRLVASLRTEGYPEIAHWVWGRHWINDVRQPASAPEIADAIRTMLRRGDEPHELTLLFRALHRCAGPDALAVYDSLMDDPSIPHAKFLWYQRQDCFFELAASPPDALAEAAGALFST